MQFRIDVTPDGDGWMVRVTEVDSGSHPLDNAGQPLVRKLRRWPEAGVEYPLPPELEAQAIPETALHHELCNPDDPHTLSDAYADALSSSPVSRAVEKLGRYLFAVLIGGEAWEWIEARRQGGPAELALSWASGLLPFDRLPWEAMHDGREDANNTWTGFLAAESKLYLTRRVADATARPEVVSSPPRVLFVVGSELHKDIIRPGAEFLGLLRSLEEKNLYLNTRLLLQASPDRLKDAVAEFNPDVVHFICHGQVVKDQPCLVLYDEKNKQPVQVNLPSLLDALQGGQGLPLPPIVVLNACSTGSAEELRVGRPLAAALVEQGVPVVVGMSGRVSDQACRLFSSGFYRALLENGHVARAAAIGRRASLRRGTWDPRSSKDWMLPALFLSAAMNQPKVDLNPVSDDSERHRFALDIAPPIFPAYCGRMELFELYDKLMAGTEYKSREAGFNVPIEVLAVSSPQSDSADPEDMPKYGRTRFLREMAAQAFRDGHIPLLVSKDFLGEPDYDQNLENYLRKFVVMAGVTTVRTLQNMARHSTLDWSWNYLTRLLKMVPGDPLPAAPPFPADIRNLYNINDDPRDPNVLAAAFRYDLLSLLEAVRQQRPPAERERIQVLVLLDDLHRLQIASQVLQLLGRFGTHPAGKSLKAIFTYADSANEGQTTALKAIEAFTNEVWVELYPLPKFHGPLANNQDEYTRAAMVYKHFLLHWQEKATALGKGKGKPLSLALSEDHENSRALVELIADDVQGIPSRLISFPDTTIRNSLKFKILRDADDEDALEAIRLLE